MKNVISVISFFVALIMLISVIPVSAGEDSEQQSSSKRTIDIWVWAEDIPQGTRISEDHIKKITVEDRNIPKNIVLDAEEIYAKYAKSDLYVNEYVSSDQISAQIVLKANSKLLKKEIVKSTDDYVYVTDYIVNNTEEDLVYFLQEIIDKNPQRTIYFPDGLYVISQPLLTSANPRESVSIQLSDGAVIKASSNWKNRGGNAMICLGGAKSENDIVSFGSYYVLSGGTLDANNRANCISVDGGRESVIKNICLKNPRTGIFIEYGVNGGSSDIDIEDITIIGSGLIGSIGIDSIGCDNTYTNIRIYDMEKGLINALGDVTNVYIINTQKSAKLNTVGITNPWRMSNCFTVNCDVGYELSSSSIVFDCISAWTSEEYTSQTMFDTKGNKALISGCRAYFSKGNDANTNLALYSETSPPIIEGCFYE